MMQVLLVQHAYIVRSGQVTPVPGLSCLTVVTHVVPTIPTIGRQCALGVSVRVGTEPGIPEAVLPESDHQG
jgi:hypothetical protein